MYNSVGLSLSLSDRMCVLIIVMEPTHVTGFIVLTAGMPLQEHASSWNGAGRSGGRLWSSSSSNTCQSEDRELHAKVLFWPGTQYWLLATSPHLRARTAGLAQ